MASTAEQIKKLREETGAGILDAKKTLDEMGGDYDKALSILKAKGIAKADKEIGRTHRLGRRNRNVCAQWQSRRDGRTQLRDRFCGAHAPIQRSGARRRFANCGNESEIHFGRARFLPTSWKRKRKRSTDATLAEGKPANIVDKIVAGKLDKYFAEHVLLKQVYIKDDKQTIEDVVKAASAQTGEKIVVRRFTRYALGE